jgi:hypothetical protein
MDPLPPIPLSQVQAFSRATGHTLPPDFVDLVTKFAGGWNFYWALSREDDTWLEPPVYMGEFGGNGEVPFIGATTETTLLDLYNNFQDEIRKGWRLNDDTKAILPALFPLQSWEGGGADFLVLRLDVSPAQVLYLDHEGAWRGTVIGAGFREFLLGWANLGFPELASHESWASSGRPQDTGPAADQWRAWLANPEE